MERVQTPSESHWLSTCFWKRGEAIIKQVLERRLRLNGDDFRVRVSFTLAGRAKASPHFNAKSPCYGNCYPLLGYSWGLEQSGPSSSFSFLSFTSQVLQPWLGRASEKSGHSGLAHSWVHHSRVCLWPSEMATGHPKGLHWPSIRSRLIQL